MCQVIRRQRDPQVVKLTPTSSGRNPSRPICCDLTPMRPNRPHIPSLTNQFQRAIVRQKTCDPPTSWRIPSRLAFRFSELSLRLTVASVRHRHVSASVRRYLRRGRGTRKSKKHLCRKKFAEAGNTRKIWWLAQESPLLARHCGNFLAGAASPNAFQAWARCLIPPLGTSRRARRPSVRTR